MSDSILSFSAVLPLRRLIDEARTMSQGDFAKRHVDHYLILEGTRPPEASRLGFRTGIVNAISRNPFMGEVEVVPLVKRDADNPFASMVTIGRARNNDVIVNEESVSKMHALIRRPADTLAATTGTITDAGSTNGTYINGARLRGNTAALQAGTRIRVGLVEFRYVDGRALHQALHLYLASVASRVVATPAALAS